MMIGQLKLRKYIYSFQGDLDKLPHTILIEGKKGSGRHTLYKDLCTLMDSESTDLRAMGINDKTINELILSPTVHFCLLDLDGISIKEQNTMLKFLEEPLNHCYIVLLCEDSTQVIPTVLNRCQHWKMDIYTKDELRSFYEEYNSFNEFPYMNDKIVDIAETPGDIIALLNACNIEDIIALVENIINNIGHANFSNVLVLVDKIKEFNKDKGIIEFDIFLKIFFYVLHECIKTNSNVRLLDMYFKLQDVYKLHKMSYLHLNEKQLYEKFLLDLKMV